MTNDNNQPDDNNQPKNNDDLTKRKKLSTKSKIFLSFQIIFMILTFIGGILLFTHTLDNAGMAVCSMLMCLAFANLYNSSRNSK